MITRRKTLLALGTGMLATPGLGRLGKVMAQSASELSGFSNPLLIPPLDAGTLQAQGRHYKLTLQHASREFLPDRRTETLGINGDYLGPTLLMSKDEQVALDVHNQLNEPSSLHWHGFHVPASEDGGPNKQIEPGTTWNPSFKVMQNGGTFWYH